jgi:anti-anti-sigma regulatory factor
MAEMNSRDTSEEMYHRVYRLIKRKLNPHTIAATLHLPLRTILGVINRIERNESPDDPTTASTIDAKLEPKQTQEFLDIYFYPKTRYAIVDLVGVLTDSCCNQLIGEFEKAFTSSWKAIAIRMSDVVSISKSIIDIIIENKEKFTAAGRFLAILDPSPEIEQTLVDFNIETILPVFGTESAFEDAAFTKKGKTFTRRGAQSN